MQVPSLGNAIEEAHDITTVLPVKKCMPLNFVSPVIHNGVSRAIVDKFEVMQLKLKWVASVVMFVVGYQPNRNVFKKFLASVILRKMLI